MNKTPIFAFLVLLLACSIVRATDISNCTTLDNASDTYYLTADILNSSDNYCMLIRADNITLDCQNHIIGGNGFGAGNSYSAIEDLYGRPEGDNLTIQNCVIDGWNTAINAQGGINYLSVYNTTASNMWWAFDLRGANNIYFYNISTNRSSELDDNAGTMAFMIGGDTNFTVENSTISNYYHPVYMWGDSSNVTFRNNVFQSDRNIAYFEDNTETGIFYNNLFNNTGNTGYEYLTGMGGAMSYLDWNTTNQSGTPIYGNGIQIGGNYWTSSPIGYSDTCTDADVDGFCDQPFDLATGLPCTAGVDCSNNTDYLPLSGDVIVSHNLSDCYTFTPFTPQGTYTLTSDIVDSSTLYCIYFEPRIQNIIFDCQNHLVDGQQIPNSEGIYISNQYPNPTLNITIQNCFVTDWDYGVEVDSDNTSVQNVTVSNSTTENFALWGGWDTWDTRDYFNNLTSYDSLGMGLDLEGYYNILENSDISNNQQGIYLWTDEFGNNTIRNCIIQNNIDYGIEIDAATGSMIYNNLFNNTINALFVNDVYANNWNTTNQSGARIFGNGTDIGGNFWADPAGTGFSQTCTDVDHDGFCDWAYDLTHSPCDPMTNCSNNTDFLPLSDNYSSPVPPSPYSNITDCTEMTTPNHTYYLTQNIINTPMAYCMDVLADNITLDCEGHTIDGDNSSSLVGINVYYINDTTIHNCVITNWVSAGIELTAATNTVIYNNTINYNDEDGIAIYAFDDATIYNNWLVGNDYGISIYDGDTGSLIYNNYFNNQHDAWVDTDNPNDWNTTKQVGTRIYSTGTDIGGNYWAGGGTCSGTATPCGDISNETACNNQMFCSWYGDGAGSCEDDMGAMPCFFLNGYESDCEQQLGCTWTAGGYSDNCIDADHDGFCDQPYDAYYGGGCTLGVDCGNNTDYLPLAGGYTPPTPPASTCPPTSYFAGLVVIFVFLSVAVGVMTAFGALTPEILVLIGVPAAMAAVWLLARAITCGGILP
jgi:parallel beta-helix repeat protein